MKQLISCLSMITLLGGLLLPVPLTGAPNPTVAEAQAAESFSPTIQAHPDTGPGLSTHQVGGDVSGVKPGLSPVTGVPNPSVAEAQAAESFNPTIQAHPATGPGFSTRQVDGDVSGVKPGLSPAQALSEPASCAEILVADPAAGDGDYVINPHGQAFTVYCHDMAGTPEEYLTLVNTGPGFNFSQYPPGGATGGITVTTVFTRVRMNPSNLTVDITDHTFATSTGEIQWGSGASEYFTWRPYAYASDCMAYYSTAGRANIDLRGTPFAVNDTFSTFGWAQAGTTETSFGGQVVDLYGGGWCGGITADPVDFPTSDWIWQPVGP